MHAKDTKHATEGSVALKTRRITTVIFDWNGTISDDLRLTYDSACSIIARWQTQRVPTLEDFQQGIGHNWRDFYKVWGVPEDVPNTELNAMRAEYFLRPDNITKANPHPGALETINALRARNLRLFLVTGETRQALMPRMTQFGLTLAFELIEHDLFGKMDFVKELTAKGWLVPGETLYIDDDARQVSQAKAFGLATIGLTFGYALPEVMRASNPDCPADDYTDVRKFLYDEAIL